MDSNSLSREEKIKRIEDPYNTKILCALILCNYKPQLDFWGSEGQFAKEITKVFPSEGPLNIDSIDYTIAPKFVKLTNKNAATQCSVGVTDASLRIESIIPGTYDYFISYAEAYLDALNQQKLFNNQINSLLRFGIRVQFLNQIKDSNVVFSKRVLTSEMTAINSFNTLIKNNFNKTGDIEISNKNIVLNQNFSATVSRGKSILSHNANISIVFGDSEVINRNAKLDLTDFETDSTCIMTDIDFYMFNCSIQEAKHLCKHSGKFAPNLHNGLIEEMKI